MDAKNLIIRKYKKNNSFPIFPSQNQVWIFIYHNTDTMDFNPAFYISHFPMILKIVDKHSYAFSVYILGVKGSIKNFDIFCNRKNGGDQRSNAINSTRVWMVANLCESFSN